MSNLTIMTASDIFWEIQAELDRAAKHGEFHSAHEGYAVLLEEVDELWEEVKLKPSLRNIDALREEAIQVAAMAVKFVQMIDRGARS